MANCYICSGYIHNKDKKVVLHKTFHNNCWNRLDRKQRLQFEVSKKDLSKLRIIGSKLEIF